MQNGTIGFNISEMVGRLMEGIILDRLRNRSQGRTAIRILTFPEGDGVDAQPFHVRLRNQEQHTARNIFLQRAVRTDHDAFGEVCRHLRFQSSRKVVHSCTCADLHCNIRRHTGSISTEVHGEFMSVLEIVRTCV